MKNVPSISVAVLEQTHRVARVLLFNLYPVIATIQVAFLLRSKTLAEHVSMLSHAHREFWPLKFPSFFNMINCS